MAPADEQKNRSDVKKDPTKKDLSREGPLNPVASSRSRLGGDVALRTLPQRLVPFMDQVLSKRPVVQVVALLALVSTLALVLGPSFTRSDSVTNTLRVGERANKNIKASRDFDYHPGEEELQRYRQAAADKVLPVFDHKFDTAAVLLSRINRAFDAMNKGEAVVTPPTDTAVAKPATTRRSKKLTAKEKPSAAKTPKKLTPTLAEGTAEIRRAQAKKAKGRRRNLFSQHLSATVPSKVFGTLQAATFSSEARATLILLVGSAMDQLVVASRRALIPFRDGSITVRHMVAGNLKSEEVLSSITGIKDLEQVRQQVRRLGSIHGAKLKPALREAVLYLAGQLIEPNLDFDRSETTRRREDAQKAVGSRKQSFVKGQVIVPDGDPITREHLRILGVMETHQGSSLVKVLVGIGLFVLLMLVTLHRFAAGQFRRFIRRPADLVMAGVLLFALLLLTRLVAGVWGHPAQPENLIFPYLVPIACGAMLVRLLVTPEAAAVFAMSIAALCGLLLDGNLPVALFYFVTSVVGAFGVRQVHSRSTILRAGISAGLFGAATVLCLQLFGRDVKMIAAVQSAFAAVGGGVLSAFMTLALLPAAEWMFAYTTDVTLLELANLNHPLLRDLMLRAPGTYHHSMVVGSLAESACEGIGANGLLARVASNYHDVGKMKNPGYFAENFGSGENPHNRLKPSMSGLIIRNHVKDGVEMMRQHGIPQLVIDTASQHHGTALIAYFYHKAAEQKEPDEEIREEDYRYPGPKPQTREAGVLMLADGVEAATRSIAEPTADRLQAVVQRIINAQFTDGQLDHCDLTLRDLHVIAKSFLRVLSGIYHARPTYPWQKGDEPRRTADETRKERTKKAGDGKPKEPRASKAKAADGSQAASGPPAASTSQAGGSKKRPTQSPDGPISRGSGTASSGPLATSEDQPSGAPDIKRLGLN